MTPEEREKKESQPCTESDVDGLPGLHVRDIQEDAKGQVFISTNAGVAKYDGQTFTTLQIVDAPPGEGWVLDPNDVWIVFQPGTSGPCRYDGKSVTRYSVGDEAYAITVLGDADGGTWVGTLEQGAFALGGEGFEPFR